MTRVSDGDTVKLAKRGWVRLFGVDARDFDEPIGTEARNFLMEEMSRSPAIRFKLGRAPREVRVTGIPGRWLGYIWLSDGRFLNEVLLAEGYVERQKSSDRPEDPQFARVLDDAERRAKAGGKRIWAACRSDERR
jgi:endonuclease YncB( thermonuclease family)